MTPQQEKEILEAIASTRKFNPAFSRELQMVYDRKKKEDEAQKKAANDEGSPA